MSDAEVENSSQAREIEAKFVVRDESLAAAWRARGGFVPGFALSEDREVEECDTYLDTADFALLRSGYTLRLRERRKDGAFEQIAGYKDIDFHTPRGVHSRVEIEEALETPLELGESLSLDDLPERLRRPLVETLGNKIGKNGLSSRRLRPVVRVQQRRYKSAVSRVRRGRPAKVVRAGKTQASFAELSIDDLIYLQPVWVKHQQTPSWEETGRATIAEVELTVDAHRSDLRTLAGRLRDLPGIEPTELGKLQSGLLARAEIRLHANTLEAGKTHTAEFCRAIWGSQLAAMLINEAGVRGSDEIEYVHQMRVATRRARAALRLYAGFFVAGNRSIKRFGKALRTTGRLLGRVRDLDVALERMQEFSEGKRNKGATGKGSKGKARASLDASMKRLTEARKHAHADLVEWLDSEKYARFMVRFADFCATPDKGVPSTEPVDGESPRPVQLRHTLPSMIWSRFETVRAFEPLFEHAGTVGNAVPVETLHALRIECKYLRYHLEFASALLGAEGEALIDAIKILQEELGALNDAVVGGEIARHDEAQETVSLPSSESANTNDRRPDGLKAWQDEQRATIDRMRDAIPGGFADFVSHENRQRLADALARL